MPFMKELNIHDLSFTIGKNVLTGNLTVSAILKRSVHFSNSISYFYLYASVLESKLKTFMLITPFCNY